MLPVPGQDAVAGILELIDFFLLPVKGLDHSNTPQVFVHDPVQNIIPAENMAEQRICRMNDEVQNDCQDGHDNGKNQGHLLAHPEGHDHRKDEHQRGPKGDPD